MRLKDFEYELPQSAISRKLKTPRDSSRLMVIDRNSKTIKHRKFSDIVDYVSKGDALVNNNTKVFPARLIGKKEKTDAKIEIFLLRELSKASGLWDVFVDPARKVRVGNKVYFEEDLCAEIVDNTTSRGRTIRFLNPKLDIASIVERIGLLPLPPYLKGLANEKDTYQTVFAEVPGAVAVPSAGLHFTPELVKKLTKIGVYFPSITLHSGFTTYKEVDVNDIAKYKLDAEFCSIPHQTAQIVSHIKSKNEGKIFSIGTTVCRVLEAYNTIDGKIKFGDSWINKFIFPSYHFKVTDCLITNFHHPKSMMLILTCAFAGYDLTMQAYEEALKKGYKFLSYVNNYDPHNMRALLLSLPKQFSTQPTIHGSIPTFNNSFTNVVILGVGGSAISGDIFSNLLRNSSPIPIDINRNYTIGRYVNKTSFVIVMSYSGNTEETLSAYEEATKSNALVVCVTSGGELLHRAKKRNQPYILIPNNAPPRTAIGYNLTALISIFQTLFNQFNILPFELNFNRLFTICQNLSERYDIYSNNNPALEIAKRLQHKLCLIYTSTDFLGAIATRWKGQFCENAKTLAFSSQIPEMNHNEIVGWTNKQLLMENLAVIFLRHSDEHPSNARRLDITEEIVKKKLNCVEKISATGNDIFEQLLSLLLLGDWISYYLALFNHVSPLPIELINHLKNKLSH
ncbi:hypothetical protein CHS0354_024088 [Potamilus streckersoni]|uniref:SIS domain-containing protein n=1 Tax=Potamilus streckersoni TaxID=2493646 RepID=A0AAE0VLC7_9BIVA|nr:hypothetical protein CHS0354_024088 [Potamilus streckersoni]